MSDLSYYLDNPDWAEKMKYAQQGTWNNNYLPRWVQGSVGGNSSMFITSNPQMYINMKHGSNNINPYRANMAGCVQNSQLRRDVANCGACLGDPVGCTFEGMNHNRANSCVPRMGYAIPPNDRRYD